MIKVYYLFPASCFYLGSCVIYPAITTGVDYKSHIIFFWDVNQSRLHIISRSLHAVIITRAFRPIRGDAMRRPARPARPNLRSLRSNKTIFIIVYKQSKYNYFLRVFTPRPVTLFNSSWAVCRAHLLRLCQCFNLSALYCASDAITRREFHLRNYYLGFYCSNE